MKESSRNRVCNLIRLEICKVASGPKLYTKWNQWTAQVDRVVLAGALLHHSFLVDLWTLRGIPPCKFVLNINAVVACWDKRLPRHSTVRQGPLRAILIVMVIK